MSTPALGSCGPLSLPASRQPLSQWGTLLHCAFLTSLTDQAELEHLSKRGVEIDVIGKL